MQLTPSLSLRIKLPLMVSLLVVGVAVTIGTAMVQLDRHRLAARLQEKALLLAQAVAVTAAEPLLRGDTWTLYKTLRQISRDANGDRESMLLSAMVVDLRSRVAAHLNPARVPVAANVNELQLGLADRFSDVLRRRKPHIEASAGYVDAIVPVQTESKSIGVVHLRLSTDALERTISEATRLVALMTLALAAIGSLIGLAWSQATLRPLRELAGSMHALGQGAMMPMAVSRRDEIGDLILQFNRMALEVEDKRRLAREAAANEKIIALGRISAGVAHEVNNPLAGMLNCLSTLRAQQNDPQLVARYLPLIETGLRRIEALVKDLLIELRVEDAHDASDPACLDEVRDLLAGEFAASSVHLHWESDLIASDKINAPKMQQILINLLRNAMQATPEGGTVACRSHGLDDQLVFEVRDNGHGIAPEDRDHLFDPFFSKRAAGTGLGLWIVLRLVQSMRGRIDIDSAPGQGATFRVLIPRFKDNSGHG